MHIYILEISKDKVYSRIHLDTDIYSRNIQIHIYILEISKDKVYSRNIQIQIYFQKYLKMSTNRTLYLGDDWTLDTVNIIVLYVFSHFSLNIFFLSCFHKFLSIVKTNTNKPVSGLDISSQICFFYFSAFTSTSII